MKVTREKRVKRNLKYYKYNFGFREPYQLLIDNTFITAALNVSLNVNTNYKLLRSFIESSTHVCWQAY